MKEIRISQRLLAKVPQLRLSCITADVSIAPSGAALLEYIEGSVQKIGAKINLGDIAKIPAIAASREGYKKLGKDPARYRLSAEALLRRVVSGKSLYRIYNAVDIINITSIKTGFSIGGYDYDKIQGDILFDSGEENEPYEAIGRGDLNIHNLPVFRDKQGAFGSPTSDSVRTSITGQSKTILYIIIDFGSLPELQDAAELAVDLLEKFAEATNIKKITV